MIAWLIATLGMRVIAYVVGAVGVGLVFTGLVWKHDNKVTARVVQQIEKKARTDVDRAQGAARQSRADADAGRVQLSPYRRD